MHRFIPFIVLLHLQKCWPCLRTFIIFLPGSFNCTCRSCVSFCCTWLEHNWQSSGPSNSVLGALGTQVGSGTPFRDTIGNQVGPGTAVSKALGRHVDSGTLAQAPKIESKSIQGPSWDAPWQSRASRERLGSISARHRHIMGAAAESAREPRDAKKDVQERPEARRGDQNRHQVASGSQKIKIVSRSLFAKHGQRDFLSNFVVFLGFGKVCKPSEVPRMPAKPKVWPFALRVESLVRCNLKKQRKSDRFGGSWTSSGP